MVFVRIMTVEDVPDTALLFAEMQTHYQVACPPHHDIAEKLTKLPEGVSIVVALDPEVVGFAAVGTIFPGPGLDSGLFLKELFVSAKRRGSGVGTELMRAVARLAVEQGFSRVDWTANRGDDRLLRYYEAAGAIEQSEKVFFRLSGQALTDFVAPPSFKATAPDSN